MNSLQEILATLDRLAPLHLAEPWDNVGLLVGDRATRVGRVMTCLTLTDGVAAEAVRDSAGLVVTHHPIPFRPLQRIVADDPTGRVLCRLLGAGVAVYSAHTAYDSAAGGVNDQLASLLGLLKVAPLTPSLQDPSLGAGRVGRLDPGIVLEQLAERCGARLRTPGVRYVGDPTTVARLVAVACGSGGSLIPAAREGGADLLVTGELTFHDCLAAQAAGMSVLLLGHYASERFAMETLADRISSAFPALTVWASRDEQDPLNRAADPL